MQYHLHLPALTLMYAQQKATVELLALQVLILNHHHQMMLAGVKANPLDEQVAGFPQLVPYVECLPLRPCHWMNRLFQKLDRLDADRARLGELPAQWQAIGDLKAMTRANSFSSERHSLQYWIQVFRRQWFDDPILK
jgi:hypothetical protein